MGARRGTLVERLWRHVDKNGPTVRADLGPCWLWTGSTDGHGYGQIAPPPDSGSNSPLKAHRVSFDAHIRPLAAGEDACHKCDNPPCVRPDHIFGGTAKDNIQDAIQKGRFRAERKTCLRGHPLTADNTIHKRNGNRLCKTCRRAIQAKHNKLSNPRHSAIRAGVRAERRAREQR